jgi:hypothetical protein
MLVAPPARFLARVLAVLPLAFAVGCNDSPIAPTPASSPKLQVLAATVVTVTNTDDSGPGSLRQAIIDADPGSIIQFAPGIAGQAIALSVYLEVDKALTIEGPVPAGMTLSGALKTRVLVVESHGDLTLRNLSLVDGRDTEGGGIFVVGGKLTLDHSLVANNETVTNGGGINADDRSEVVLVNSTMSGNVAGLVGGGIITHGALTIRNSTIAENSSQGGGGIAVLGTTSALSLRNSIIANNVNVLGTTEANCMVDHHTNASYTGGNITNGDCVTDPAVLIADPKLGSLANNGGPTKTYALLYGSPAIDGGLLCTETTDQRYVARNQGITCDVGAFEFNDYAKVTLTIGPNVGMSAKTGITTVSGTIACSRPTTTTLAIALSQTQKVTGRFTTIVQGSATTPTLNCATAPSSWSVTVTPAAGKFENGTATGRVAASGLPTDYLPADVTSPIKIFTVK